MRIFTTLANGWIQREKKKIPEHYWEDYEQDLWLKLTEARVLEHFLSSVPDLQRLFPYVPLCVRNHTLNWIRTYHRRLEALVSTDPDSDLFLEARFQGNGDEEMHQHYRKIMREFLGEYPEVAEEDLAFAGLSSMHQFLAARNIRHEDM